MLIKLNEIKKGRDFRLLCLEEPEAHLHPAMQYKLFKYLRDLDKADKLNQQIFVTTHSSNISAVAGLDNMFMLSYNRSLDPIDCEQQSLFALFESGPEERKVEKKEAKKHLAKFLDVTRSDLLFADKVIFVEGIAEKLLMPAFMEKCGVPYEDEHISIVEIGGKHFEHFIELFNGNAVKKKVLCITDKDFCWIEDKKLRSLSDYDAYVPNHIQKLSERFNISDLKVCTQKHYGRTFEDELFLENIAAPDLTALLFRKVAGEKIIEFLDKYGLTLSSWIAHKDEIDGRVAKSVLPFLTAYTNRADPEPTKEATYSQIAFAEMFLHYAEKQKGDFALEILTDDSLLDEQGTLKLTVPEYIREGLEWLKD
jgi:predicted ATP-dependent endonuclease of OLD family